MTPDIEKEDDESIDDDLYQRTISLLEPGDIDLAGLIVHTDIPRGEDIQMHQTTVDIATVIVEYILNDPSDWYIYSGNDDPKFASNVHQGLTISNDRFVWECQQIVRNGSYAIIFYYETINEQESLVESVRELGYPVRSVELPGNC